MKQHKWHKEIKAWADGEEIQIRLPKMTQSSEAFDWMDLGDNDIFRCMNRDYEFRIKPQPCMHEDEPRGCYRVRCQLGKKCVDDGLSFRKPQPKEPQYLYVYRDVANKENPFITHDDGLYYGKPPYAKIELKEID